MSEDGRRDRRRVGDATLKRIGDLADGWKVRGKGDQGPDSGASPLPQGPVDSRPRRTGPEKDAASEPVSDRSAAPAATTGTHPEPTSLFPRAQAAPLLPRPARDSRDDLGSDTDAGAAADDEDAGDHDDDTDDPTEKEGPAARSDPGRATPSGSSASRLPAPAPSRSTGSVAARLPPPSPSREAEKSPPASPAPRSARKSVPPPPPRAGRPSEPPPPPPAGARSPRKSRPPPVPGPGPRPAPRASEPPPSAPRPAPALETEPAPRIELSTLDRSDPSPPPVGKGTGSVLRIPTALPRRRGPLGDVAYVFTSIFGVASARRELAEGKKKLAREKETRLERLGELARQTVADPQIEVPLVEEAREQLVEIEERRSQKAGAAAASEEEIARLRAERVEESKKRAEALQKLESEQKAVRASLEPLEKKMTAARRRAAAYRRQLEEIDDKIGAEERRLVAAKPAAVTPAEIEANIATLRAERQSIAAEEPVLAAAIDELEPKIASLKASREELERKCADLREMEAEAGIRTEEKIAAIRAKKAVEEREVADVARVRQRALEELGDALSRERPAELTARLRGVEQIEMNVATLERRLHELGDLIHSVERSAVVRGVLYLAVAAAAIGTLVFLLVLR